MSVTEPEESQDRSKAGTRGQDGGADAKTPLLEWIVGALSAALVLALLGFIVMEGVTREALPPDLLVMADSVSPVAAGYLQLVTIHNDGDATAAQVHVAGALLKGDSTVEGSNTILDYVPISARRRGALQFQHDPAEYKLELRVTGFSEP